MDLPRTGLLVSTGAGVLLAFVLMLSSLAPPAASGASIVLAPTSQGHTDGLHWGPGSREATSDPLKVAMLDGPAPQAAWGIWDGEPIVVLKLDVDTLRAASQHHDRNLGQYAVPHPFEPGKALVAFSATSTFLGCTVGFLADIGASLEVPDYDEDGRLDGRLVDVCHQGTWDVYAMGTNQPNGPAPEPLDVITLDLRVNWAEASIWGVERIHQEQPFDADRQGPGAPFALAE